MSVCLADVTYRLFAGHDTVSTFLTVIVSALDIHIGYIDALFYSFFLFNFPIIICAHFSFLETSAIKLKL